VTSIKPKEFRPVPEMQLSRSAEPLSKNPEKVSKQFEALLLKQMINSMWSTVPQEGLLSGSHEEGLYRDMLNEALANSISEGRGIGIKDVILKDIKKYSKNS
jgi:Rod binding domain-containing protein